jgi:hypothetical protein
MDWESLIATLPAQELYASVAGRRYVAVIDLDGECGRTLTECTD